jgi:ribonuclease PH
MNVVMTASQEFVEVQGTAEREPFAKATLDELTALATDGIRRLIEIQKQALGG